MNIFLVAVVLSFVVIVVAASTCPACSSGFNSDCLTCPDCDISIINGKCTCGDGSACENIDSSCCSNGVHKARTSPVQPSRLSLGCFLCLGTCCPDGHCYQSGSLCCTGGNACPSTAPICCPPAPGSSTPGCCPSGTTCGPNRTCITAAA